MWRKALLCVQEGAEYVIPINEFFMVLCVLHWIILIILALHTLHIFQKSYFMYEGIGSSCHFFKLFD